MKSLRKVNEDNNNIKVFSYANQDTDGNEGGYDRKTQSDCAALLEKLKYVADNCTTKIRDEEMVTKINKNLNKLQKEVELMTDDDVEDILKPTVADSLIFDTDTLNKIRQRREEHESIGSLLSSFTSADLNQVTISSIDSCDIFLNQ